MYMKQMRPPRFVVPKLPEKYEKFTKKICGEWRYSSQREMEGALGVAMCKAIIDGQPFDLFALAHHLGIESELLKKPYERLSRNGYMKGRKLLQDDDLRNGDVTSWCFLAGTASGATGN